jgi:G8 domain
MKSMLISMELCSLLLLICLHHAFSYSDSDEHHYSAGHIQEIYVYKGEHSYPGKMKPVTAEGRNQQRMLKKSYISRLDNDVRTRASNSENVSDWQDISYPGNFSDWQNISQSGNFTKWQESNNVTNSPSSDIFEVSTSSPTHVVTAVPTTISPTSFPTPYIFPSGPYVSSVMSNERIRVPDPPFPNSLFDSEESQFNCPHLDSDLLDWHDNQTWSGKIPVSFENVTLPENSRVVIRESVVTILGYVIIPSSSELIFGEHHLGITFETKGISVKGKLTIGSSTCRIGTPITITLHGSRPIDAVKNIPPPEYKGISVTGTISLHGKRFYRTWTRLALTVNPGDSILMLQNEVNWMPGQTIVLVTTALKDSREWHRNELAVVKKVILNPKAGVGAAVALESPVIYQHLAFRGYQGEVGLLSRSIKIQGSTASEPTDRDPLTCLGSRSYNGDRAVPCPNTELTGFGGHIIVHLGGKGYVEGTELFRMGQTNVMGRYPMHFHLLGRSCSDCYFRDSSIHRSFYRCASIHATDLIQVSENVAYDVTGF